MHLKYPEVTKHSKKYLISKPDPEAEAEQPISQSQQQHCVGSVTTHFSQLQPLGDFCPWSSLESPTTFNQSNVQNQPLINNDPFLTTAVGSCSSPLGPSVALGSSSPSASPSRSVALENQQQQQVLNELWSPEALFEDLYNPMVCCNPREVEGIAARTNSELAEEDKEKKVKVEESPIVDDAEEKEASASPNLGVVEDSSFGPSIKQDFFEEDLFQQQLESPIATPQQPIASFAEEDSILEPEMMEDFDLMEFVGDDAMPVNHPDFLDLLAARPLENISDATHINDVTTQIPSNDTFSTIDGSAIGLAATAPQPSSVQSQPVPANATVIPAVVTQVNNDFFVTVASNQAPQEEKEVVQDHVEVVAEEEEERPPVHKIEAMEDEANEEDEGGVSNNDDHAYGMRVAHQRAPRMKMATREGKYRRMRDLNNDD